MERISLIESIKLIAKLSYWFFILPNWTEFGAHLYNGTLIGASLVYLTINIFILSGTLIVTIASLQSGDTFAKSSLKIYFMVTFLIYALGHIWYLFQQWKIQQFLKSFQKLESKVAAMQALRRQQDLPAGKKSFTVIYVVSFIITLVLAVNAVIITVQQWFKLDPSQERVGLFNYEFPWPSVSRPLLLVIYIILIVQYTNLTPLIEYAPVIVYNHQSHLIDALSCASTCTFATVRNRGSAGPAIVNELNEIWANYEHLSILNDKSIYMFGMPIFLAHSQSFIQVCVSVYLLFDPIMDVKLLYINVTYIFICTFRLMFSIVMLSKVKKSSQDLALSFCASLSQSVSLLYDEEKKMAKFILCRLKTTELSANVMDMYSVDLTLILPLFSLSMSTILLLLNYK